MADPKDKKAAAKKKPERTPNSEHVTDSRFGLRTGVPGVKKGTDEALPIDPMPADQTPFQAPATTTRRDAMLRTAAWGLFGFSGMTAVGGLVSYLFPRAPFDPKQVFKAGFAEDYPPESVSEAYKQKFQVWITHTEYDGQSMIYALSTVCTHLGCTPNWLEADGKFKCPCHGSGFYPTGVNFEGPAPRPLERFKIFIGDDGQIVVDKTKKYQQEKGEWDNPDSYLLA